ncbi:arabinosidase [Morchella snyderi]|nr:arabinosidase [Morchella snyderi]
MRFLKALPFLSSLFLLPAVSPAEYVFTSFTETSERDMYIWGSSNATSWDLIKGPAYTPATGLLRDPSIMLKDGTYYVAHTTGWTGRNFALITSTDLLSWTPFATIEITNTTITRTWAPEIWKDPKTKKVHIIVSLGTSNPDFTTNLYTATNDALTEWEGPVVMEGIPSNYIDTVLVYKDGVYHAFTKGVPNTEHAVADNVEGPYTLVQTGDFAGWGEMEGPTVVRLADGRYRIFGDRYKESRYIYSDSWDLYEWTAPQDVPQLTGVLRHGTVIRVDSEQYDDDDQA